MYVQRILVRHRRESRRQSGPFCSEFWDITTKDIATLIEEIDSYRTRGTEQPITEKIAVGRLVPGAAGYPKALGRIGARLKDAKAIMKEIEPFYKEYQRGKNLMAMAQDLFAVVCELRHKDMDQPGPHSRVQWLNRQLCLNVITKSGTNTAGVAGPYEIFDAKATIMYWKEERPNIEAELRKALKARKNQKNRQGRE